jgi:hypothetical protein
MRALSVKSVRLRKSSNRDFKRLNSSSGNPERHSNFGMSFIDRLTASEQKNEKHVVSHQDTVLV